MAVGRVSSLCAQTMRVWLTKMRWYLSQVFSSGTKPYLYIYLFIYQSTSRKRNKHLL